MIRHTITVFKNIEGQWRWNVQAANRKIVASSGEGFKRRIDAINAIVDLLRLPRPQRANRVAIDPGLDGKAWTVTTTLKRGNLVSAEWGPSGVQHEFTFFYRLVIVR